jgi:glucan phosphoethanolaminetransferase (alkaline phosphatase superfamily)
MDSKPAKPWSGLLRSAPLWTTVILAGIFVAAVREPFSPQALPALGLSLLLALGFWTLLLGSIRALQHKTRWSLLITMPVLLVLLAAGVIQTGHHFIYGGFVDGARLGLALTNWEVVSGEIGHFVQSFGWLLPAGAAALALIAGLALERSRTAWLRPLHGAGGLHAAAAVTFGVWLVWSPFQAATPPRLPDLAGVLLIDHLRDHAHWNLLRAGAGARQMPRPVGWLLNREGVQPLAAPEPSQAPRPNVLFILLESVRADHLTPYGYARDTTPHLDAFAKRPDVTVFPKAFSNATFSYFSMLSLTSGLDLRRAAAQIASAPLIWDHLKLRDYQTFLITFSLGYPAYGLDRFLHTPGLDLYRDLGRERIDAKLSERPPSTLSGRLIRALRGEWNFDESLAQRDDQATLEALRDALASRRRDAPFFALWELECTHYRYCYSEEFRRFEPASPYAFSRRDPAPLVNEYDNALAYTDHQIQRALTLLEDEGIADETVVVIAADHGEAFYENGTVFHGFGLHAEQTHVPFLLRIPTPLQARYPASALAALARNRRAPVQLVDLLPTIVALADGDTTPAETAQVDGANLLAPLPEREIYVTNYPPWRRKAERSRPHARVESDGVLTVVHDDGRPDERFPIDPAGAGG